MEGKRTGIAAELEAEERFLESARGLAERGLMSAAKWSSRRKGGGALRTRGEQWRRAWN
jgi:hypothetical protein